MIAVELINPIKPIKALKALKAINQVKPVADGVSGQHQAGSGRRLQLGGQEVLLDRGHIAVIAWPDAASLKAQVNALCELAVPVVRYVGGTLIDDLSLQDNLMLEPALHDGSLPTQLLPELDALFELTASPANLTGWAHTWPLSASKQALMQVQVGRTLMADPDVLIVDADQWDDELMRAAEFSCHFVSQYPWRTLVWATHDAARASSLRIALGESATDLMP